MNRGLFYGLLSGFALSVGAYASYVFNSPLEIYFDVLCSPGVILEVLLTPRSRPISAHSPHWLFIGTILSYGLIGLCLQWRARIHSTKPRLRPKKEDDPTGN